jgi:hypothetical protein
MALKANRVFTVSKNDEGVVLWDTTLRPLCIKFRAYDSEARGYDSLFSKLKDADSYTFTSKSGVKYIVQRLER